MKKKMLWQFLGLALILMLAGCATKVRTYTVVKDRVDQDLTAGNRGYISGNIPQTPTPQRRTTRNTYVTEIELPGLKKAEPIPMPETQQEQKTYEVVSWGVKETQPPEEIGEATGQEAKDIPEVAAEAMEKYTVRKGDTLQKISKKFYGTTKKWKKIFNANKDTLKAANKIYPGQSINVPVPSPKQPAENLK